MNLLLLHPAALLALVAACAAPPADPRSSSPLREAKLLSSSDPADGAVLSRAPANLILSFSRPARLQEVVVAGSDGTLSPIMVTAAGELRRYSTPLPELQPGAYQVTWRAQSEGRAFSGALRFSVR